MNDKLNRVINVTKSDLLKAMTYISIDLEAWSRRNNLIFREYMEIAGENCF